MYYILSTTSSKISNRLLQHQYVLVTGCDTGFGRAIVEKLDRIGVHVFAGCLTHSAVEELKSQSSRIIPFVMDVTKTADIEKAVTLVKKELPEGRGLWGIVNNAGVGHHGFIEWISVERFRQVCQVNLFGLIDVTCHFLPLIKKEKGRIVNMASSAGINAPPRLAAYSVSKHGVVAFNNALRIEMIAFDVGVHCICPTFFGTDILNIDRAIKEINAQYDQASDEVKKSYDGVLEHSKFLYLSLILSCTYTNCHFSHIV